MCLSACVVCVCVCGMYACMSMKNHRIVEYTCRSTEEFPTDLPLTFLPQFVKAACLPFIALAVHTVNTDVLQEAKRLCRQASFIYVQCMWSLMIHMALVIGHRNKPCIYMYIQNRYVL